MISNPGSPYIMAVNDLAFIIAQITSGITGVDPEQEDFELAEIIEPTIRDLIEEYYCE